MLSVVATQLTTPDTTRAYTVNACGMDLTSDVKFDSLVIEDQGTSAQGTTSFLVVRSLANMAQVIDQGIVTIEDHVSGTLAFRGFVDSRRPARLPGWNQTEIIASDHTSLLDNVIPFELRPSGESDAARIGYLWGLYAGHYLNASLANVTQVSASLPAQTFASVTLRQALDAIAAQASSSAFWYVDSAGRLHYGTTETNNAPKNVTSDTPGAGEIAPQDLDIDYDSKSYVGAVYVRGKTEAGSGWVYSQSSRLNRNGLIRTAFFDAPDCTTSTMRDALGNMYLGRVGSAISRGSFSTTSADGDGWRAGQNVTVRSSHLNSLNQSFRIARVRTRVLGPLGTRPAALRQYDVEFGGAQAGLSGGSGVPVTGTGIVGDMLDEYGNTILGSSTQATTGGLGGAIRRFIMSGVYNGDFGLVPPLPSSPIVNSYNPLPYWTFTQRSGTAITATAAEDSTVGSGYTVRFDMAAGAASDDAYLEQIIPINSSKNQTYWHSPMATWVVSSSTSAAEIYVEAQYLKSDGTTTTGASGTLSQPTNTAWGNPPIADQRVYYPTLIAPPTDAYYLRVRVGFKRAGAATSLVESVTLTEVRLRVGGDYTFLGEVSAPSTYGPGRLSQNTGSLQIMANYLGTGASPNLNLDGSTTSPAGGKVSVSSTTALAYDVMGCRVYRSTLQTIATATVTAVTFDSERFDAFGYHSTTSNTSRITIPAGLAGKYLIGAHAYWAGNATGDRQVRIVLNNTTVLSLWSDPSADTNAKGMDTTTLWDLAAGDYVEMQVYQSSGGNLDLRATPGYSPEFWCVRVGV